MYQMQCARPYIDNKKNGWDQVTLFHSPIFGSFRNYE